MIDLHSHSSASDGQYSPSELVKKAADESVLVLALTDHDTVAGLEEAREAAESFNITFVPGIELEIQWPKGEFHLLGLGIKNVSEDLRNTISFVRDGRTARNLEIIKKMRSDGINITMEEMQSEFKDKPIGRPHFADILIKHKIVRTRQQAFDKFLGRGRPWYVPRVGANLDDAVQAIVSSGGVPVIAHPLSLYVSLSRIDDVLIDIFSRGVQGLEAWHSGAKISEAERLEGIARKIGFFITGGSDFHGEEIRADRRLGRTAGGLKINDKFWYEELLPRLG